MLLANSFASAASDPSCACAHAHVCVCVCVYARMCVCVCCVLLFARAKVWGRVSVVCCCLRVLRFGSCVAGKQRLGVVCLFERVFGANLEG